METDETDTKSGFDYNIEDSYSAINSSILEYYKKFGRKRDLEQFFSLSTTQSDIKDPSSIFWRRMKSQYDSSDSGDNKKSESSTELCRISIKCSIPEPGSSKEDNARTKIDSVSPPIISEEAPTHQCQSSDNDSDKSNDVQSQKSHDCTLDTSMNKPISPTSSVTSQRRLEWDSLADVGYANESDRKNSASSLSTLERMALQQQYSNETKHNSDLGPPTAQSTPVDVSEVKMKSKKMDSKKSTKIYKKDVDLFELNVPQMTEYMKPINVNLTKHISFNVERDGGVSVENMTKSVSLSPEKVSVETAITPQVKMDKEIQTTLIKTKDHNAQPKQNEPVKKIPVLISVNTLKKRVRRKKVRKLRRQNSRKQNVIDKENIPEKHAEPVSDAESFEYMPGHIYNQNQLKIDKNTVNPSGNKSSLESSAGLTTDSSKTSKYSFTKDLEKGIDMLKNTLDYKCDDPNLKKKLIRDVVEKLIKSKYRDDESSTEFLSGLTFESKKLDLYNQHHTTTSTSENDTMKRSKLLKPKKSILRIDKFNSGPVASTSQSVPNLHTVINQEKPIAPKIGQIQLSHTDSDISNKNKITSDTGIDKISSEQLYQKYLEALQREQAYKRHLKDKEIFLKQKLASSDIAFDVVRHAETKTQNRIKDLMKDLIRNNYDDGSGDASRLEGGSGSNLNIEQYNSARRQRSHSVFTLSSGTSDNHYKQAKLTKCTQDADALKTNFTKTDNHYCCCPYHKAHPKIGVVDSSVQVNLNCCKDYSPVRTQTCSTSCAPVHQSVPYKCEKCNTIYKTHKLPKCVPEDRDEIKYVCLCTEDTVTKNEMPENILIYKCSRLNSKGLKVDTVLKASNAVSAPSSNSTSPRKISTFGSQDCERKCLVIKDSNSSNIQTKSSQTDLNLRLALRNRTSEQSTQSSTSEDRNDKFSLHGKKPSIFVHEATRVVQTEMSIDPKISDPSISDINIVNDECCVQLISERFKEITQNSSRNQVNKCLEGAIRMEEREPVNIVYANTKETSTNTVEKHDKEIQSSPDVPNTPITEANDRQGENNFTIPIQGTNMMLKVSLGSENKGINKEFDRNLLKKTEVESTSKGTETLKNDVVENFTSLREDCSKAVQCNDTNIFKNLCKKPEPSCGHCNTYQEKTPADIVSSELNNKANCKLNTKPTCEKKILTDNKCNTFPRNDRCNVQKPLLRSNTDTGKMERCCRVTFNKKSTKDDGVQPDPEILKEKQQPKGVCTEKCQEKYDSCCSEKSLKSIDVSSKSKFSSDIDEPSQLKPSTSESDDNINKCISRDPLIEMIQDITKRYSKKDYEKGKRKKCFKEIITVLNYFLDTEESTDKSTDQDINKTSCSTGDENKGPEKKKTNNECCGSIPSKTFVDKSVQLSSKKSKTKQCTESSDLPLSSDLPSTSSDSATCKVLNKIKRECEKYHQKRCKSYNGAKKCDASSSTSVNCNQCRKVHHCSCRGHKCKNHNTKTLVEKTKRNCIAYNLIIQTSDSMISEEVTYGNKERQLQNIIVKVPSKRKEEDIPFKEMSRKIEKKMKNCSPRCGKNYHRSKSCPNESEISSTDEFLKRAREFTVREYLEQNRPDFVEKSSNRQHCLKLINESRANERITKRQLLSLQLDKQQTLNSLTNTELQNLARELGNELRRKKVAPKFINEREMKKHSEKIYKSLPEVMRQKEEMKKENIKKTNLLMASLFKKNLQKKTLSGDVNLSNYNTVIKI
ncbi:hypothetical protein KGM_207016 [Danaus plexippus plexippus]|uniref:Uncharacterized protein n=1 Tax=Danaus plexippus plexippus TaxID=278856 RepID=A0A212FME7_DANPL|nr:hypothetical protein KGM_207016 [Danaus plexippus plexippus]